MPRAIRVREVTPVVQNFDRFDRGIVSGLNMAGKPVRHLYLASNLVWQPETGFESRPGYRDVSLAVLPSEPHSLMAFYGTPDRFFVAADDDIYEILEVGGYSPQTLPGTWTANRWSDTNLNGVLVATQEGGSNAPIALDGSGWLTIVLPAPGAAPVAAAAAGTNGTPGLHKFRIRWRFKNGSSIAGPSVDHTIAAGPNQAVSLTVIPNSARADYLGWTLEVTKVGDTTLWWRVADGTGTSYVYDVADESLGELIGAEPGVHGSAPHLDGVVSWRNRLWGWAGTTIYVSQAVADPSEASGIFNFHPSNQFPIDADDGDSILQVVDAGDRLVIFKHSSIHVIEGFDLDNFLRRKLPTNVGGASTRGAIVIGGRVYFYGGDGQFYVLRGNREEEIGSIELDFWTKRMEFSRDDEVVAFEYEKGRYAAWAVSFTGKGNGQDQLLYEIQAERWAHFDNIGVADVLVPKEPGAFGRAKALVADPQLLAPSSTQTASTNPSYHIWSDSRAAQRQYYAQKVDSNGSPMWSPGTGIIVSTSSVSPTLDEAALVPDGAGGMFCAFIEGTTNANGQIVLQHLDATGAETWGVNGVFASDSGVTTDRKDDLDLVSDGAGGVIVAWIQKNNGVGAGIRVQRFDAAGVAQWTAGGVEIVAPGVLDNRDIKCLATTDGGVFVAWADVTGSQVTKFTRVTSGGLIHAGWGGIKTGAQNFIHKPGLAPDGQGGLWIFSAGGVEAFVQRFIGASGVAAFAAVPMTPSLSAGVVAPGPCMVADGEGGVIFAASTWPWGGGGASDYKVLAQRVDFNGNRVWNIDCVPLGLQSDPQLGGPRMVQDGAGGAIVVWRHSTGPGNFKFHAQRITPSGATLWGSDGLVWRDVAVPGGENGGPFTVCTDGGGGVIVLSQDDRPGSGAAIDNLYIQRIRGTASEAWTLDGVQLVALAGSQNPMDSEFTGAAEFEFPEASAPGWHVWAAFEGQLDRLGADGTGGIPIPFFAQTPFSDDGYIDVEKEYDRIEILGKMNTAVLSVSILVDNAAAGDSVPISVDQTGSRWGSIAVLPSARTLIWNQGRWSSSRPGDIVSPFKQGVFGKRASIVIASQLTDLLEIDAINLDYQLLPDRSFVR